MESPTPVSRYIRQDSKKKRAFLGGSSSSPCKEVEVLEISPPRSNRASKPKSSKKKVKYPEVIDVDVEEEDFDGIILANEPVGPNAKGKEISSTVGLNSLANDDSGGLHDSISVDDYNSNFPYGEEEWIDKYRDDITYDDYASLESHFDHMDIPPGVEAPFPWFPSSPGNKVNLPTSSISKAKKSMQPQLDGVNLSHSLNSSHSSEPSKQTQINDLPLSNSMTGNSNRKGKQASNPMEPGPNHKKRSASSFSPNLSSTKGSSSHKSLNEDLHSSGKGKRRHRSSQTIKSSHHSQFPPPPTPPTPFYPPVNGSGSYPFPNLYPIGMGPTGSFMPVGQSVPMNMFESLGTSGLMNGSGTFSHFLESPAYNLNGSSSAGSAGNSVAIKVEQRNLDEILRNFDHFKKFDTVEDFSDHHYSKNGSAKQVAPPKNWAKRIQEEWKILEKDLPDEIFVRVYESRMDLLRAVIRGAEGTPYHDGLFFFDVFFPSSYPSTPPHVHYHSGGLRINPNLYNCGKVCLSLLNTWGGSQKEKWIPGMSTMLQVLVSIQGLILNAKPYFNEPGYANSAGSAGGEKSSLDYNEKTFMLSLQTMVYSMRRPPRYFEDFVVGHFCKHARDILMCCKAYLEGAQVGCLLKGGVQDVDEGDKGCSNEFKNNLAGFITTLVDAFTQIGAKDCQEFLSLAKMGNLRVSARTTTASKASKGLKFYK